MQVRCTGPGKPSSVLSVAPEALPPALEWGEVRASLYFVIRGQLISRAQFQGCFSLTEHSFKTSEYDCPSSCGCKHMQPQCAAGLSRLI